MLLVSQSMQIASNGDTRPRTTGHSGPEGTPQSGSPDEARAQLASDIFQQVRRDGEVSSAARTRPDAQVSLLMIAGPAGCTWRKEHNNHGQNRDRLSLVTTEGPGMARGART